MTNKEILKSLLGQFFMYNKYKEAILLFRKELEYNHYYSKSWADIKAIISSRKLEDGEALYLIIHTANLPLDEDSDEEAYKWLDIMIDNVDAEQNKEIIEY